MALEHNKKGLFVESFFCMCGWFPVLDFSCTFRFADYTPVVVPICKYPCDYKSDTG